jgi:regulatory protein
MTDAIDREEAAEIERGALRLLASREHTRLELRRKLARHHDEGQICPVLDELERRRLLSDARFAENYVRQRSRRGYGPLRLRAELTGKGVDRALAARYIEDGAVDWSVQLLEVAMRKFGDEPATDRQALARRGRFLQQRGFPVSLVAQYLDRVRAF